MITINELRESVIATGLAGLSAFPPPSESKAVLAMLAHELRNPLACVMQAVHELRNEEVREAEMQRMQAVESIERHARRLSWIVDDVLGLSRAEHPKVAQRSTLLDAAIVMENAQDSVRELMRAQGHTLVVEAPRNALWICADAGQLEQVLVNLLSNAARYTKTGGRIVLQGAREGPDVVIRVSDNGIGIAKEMLESVFAMFVRVDSARALANDGLGIGLTVVRLLVELNRGTVTVCSEGVGHGSTFVVRFPAAATNRREINERGDVTAIKLRTNRILIVEDNRDLSQSLSRLLRLDGHTVQCAPTAAVALELASAFQPEFALVDISLPDLSGYEVAALLHGVNRSVELRVATMSGYNGKEDRSLSEAAGCICHLQKPVDITEIKALLAGDRANGG